jgi:hypothetical protein
MVRLVAQRTTLTLVRFLSFDLLGKADSASSYPNAGIALRVIGTRK